MPPPPGPLECGGQTPAQAREIVNDLRARQTELEAKRALLEQERDDISYSARVIKDTKANARLVKVGDLLVQLDHEMHSLAAATRTAEQKVLEAEGVQKSEIERERVEWALELGTTMRDHAKAADQALAQALQHYMALRETMTELNRIGAVPSVNPFDVNARRALVTVFQATPFAVGFLAPNERHTLVELSERWSAGVQHFA